MCKKNSGMMKTTIILLSMVITIIAVELPKGLKVCSQSNPHIEKCLAKAIKSTIITLANGNKALKIPTVEPLVIEHFTLGASGPVSLIQNYWNFTINGLTKDLHIVVKNYTFKDTLSFHVDALCPRLDITADYKLNGQILLLPIRGQGESKLTFGNVMLKIDTQYDTYKRNDETYFKTKKLDLKIVDMRDRQLHYSNLFGNALLGERMNTFINEHSKELVNAMIPSVNKIMAETLFKLATSLFDQLPQRQLFPS